MGKISFWPVDLPNSVCGRVIRLSAQCVTSLRLRKIACLFAGTMMLAASGAFGQMDDEHLGLTEYEVACMPCHGIDGRGPSPVAEQLKKRPSDLTQLAKSNNGRFPRSRIIEFIDGRVLVAAHGAREMPVWGDRYRRVVLPGETRRDADHRARSQIEALVRYLEGIQLK